MVHFESWRVLDAHTARNAVVMATAKTDIKMRNFFLSFIESTVVP